MSFFSPFKLHESLNALSDLLDTWSMADIHNVNGIYFFIQKVLIMGQTGTELESEGMILNTVS